MNKNTLLAAIVAAVGTVSMAPTAQAICMGLAETYGCSVNGIAPGLCEGTSGRDVIIAPNDGCTKTADPGPKVGCVISGLGGGDIGRGSNLDDTLCAGDGRDLLGGGAGDDTLFGGAGNDLLGGEAGDDTVRGEAGDDLLGGGAGDDILDGGDGDDTLDGGDGRDLLDGGDGRDGCVMGETNVDCEIP